MSEIEHKIAALRAEIDKLDRDSFNETVAKEVMDHTVSWWSIHLVDDGTLDETMMPDKLGDCPVLLRLDEKDEWLSVDDWANDPRNSPKIENRLVELNLKNNYVDILCAHLNERLDEKMYYDGWNPTYDGWWKLVTMTPREKATFAIIAVRLKDDDYWKQQCTVTTS